MRSSGLPTPSWSQRRILTRSPALIRLWRFELRHRDIARDPRVVHVRRRRVQDLQLARRAGRARLPGSRGSAGRPRPLGTRAAVRTMRAGARVRSWRTCSSVLLDALGPIVGPWMMACRSTRELVPSDRRRAVVAPVRQMTPFSALVACGRRAKRQSPRCCNDASRQPPRHRLKTRTRATTADLETRVAGAPARSRDLISTAAGSRASPGWSGISTRPGPTDGQVVSGKMRHDRAGVRGRARAAAGHPAEQRVGDRAGQAGVVEAALAVVVGPAPQPALVVEPEQPVEGRSANARRTRPAAVQPSADGRATTASTHAPARTVCSVARATTCSSAGPAATSSTADQGARARCRGRPRRPRPLAASARLARRP